MDSRGSLIVYDLRGKIWLHIPDAIGTDGSLPLFETPEGLPFIITEYGELDNKILLGVDVSVEPHKLIVEDIIAPETEEDRLRKENIELENQLLLAENKNLGGIL